VRDKHEDRSTRAADTSGKLAGLPPYALLSRKALMHLIESSASIDFGIKVDACGAERDAAGAAA